MADNERDKRGRRKRPPTSNPPSNPGKFFGDPDRLAAFFEAVEVFGNISDACEMVGVSRTVVYDERDRNPEFATLLVKAKRQKHFKIIKTITDVALEGPKGKRGRKQDWRAGAWILERENSARYGKRDPNAVTPEMMSAVANGLVADLLPFIPPDLAAAALEKAGARISDFAKSFKSADPDEDELERPDEEARGDV